MIHVLLRRRRSMTQKEKTGLGYGDFLLASLSER